VVNRTPTALHSLRGDAGHVGREAAGLPPALRAVMGAEVHVPSRPVGEPEGGDGLAGRLQAVGRDGVGMAWHRGEPILRHGTAESGVSDRAADRRQVSEKCFGGKDFDLVGLTGFEPATSWSRTSRHPDETPENPSDSATLQAGCTSGCTNLTEPPAEQPPSPFLTALLALASQL